MARRYDEEGHVIVRDNSDLCRDCGKDDRNIFYQDTNPNGTIRETYCQCYGCDPDRGLYVNI